MNNIIGNNIKKLRDEMELSQQQLAEALNVGRETVTRWENGTRDIKSGSIIDLARFFNVTSDYLLGLSNSKTLEGAEIERSVGLSEESIRKLKKYKLTYTPKDIEMLNNIIQNDSIMKICVFIDTYNRNTVAADKVQVLITNYIKHDIFFYGHSIEQLKDYFNRFEVDIPEKELKEIDEFIKTYIDISSKSNKYASGVLNLVSIEDHNLILLEDASKLFNEIIDELTEG